MWTNAHCSGQAECASQFYIMEHTRSSMHYKICLMKLTCVFSKLLISSTWLVVVAPHIKEKNVNKSLPLTTFLVAHVMDRA